MDRNLHSITPGLLAQALRQRQAACETADFREIPTRFELPGQREEDPGRTVATNTRAAELGRLIRSREPLQRRVDAVRRLSVLIHEKSFTDADHTACVHTVTQAADWLLSREVGLPFRRYGVFMLFCQAYSKVDSSLPFDPADPRKWTLWESVKGLRRRGLKDKDAKLKEYFRRYVPLKQEPNWRQDRERMLRVTEQIVSALPQHEDVLRECMRHMGSIQESQLQVHSRLGATVALGLPPQQRAQFIRAENQKVAYRLHSAWANLYSASIIEVIGQEAARRFGVAKAEVKLGWPAYTQPDEP